MDIRYLAGFFDGEGSIGIYQNTSSSKINPDSGFYLKVQLTQNNHGNALEIFDYLKENFGGNVSHKKTLSGKDGLRWQIGSTKAVNFLKALLPFSVTKHDQILLALWWQGNRPEITRNEKGQVALSSYDFSIDKDVNLVMKALKIMPTEKAIEQINNEQRQHTLRQIMCVKG